MPDERRQHLTFLMRLWQAQSDGRLVWRMSLEDAHTGIRCGFADLASLVAYLDAQLTDTEESCNDDAPLTQGGTE